MNNHAIKSGLIIGVISIVITLVLYVVNAAALVSMWMLLLLVLFLFLVAYFGIQHRKEIGGFMSFGTAWVYSMQVFVVAGIAALVVAWLTISFKSLYAARANPVEALRYE